MSFSLGKLSGLLAIASGGIGLANSSDFASALASGAAVISGAAGLAGQANLAKIAGVASLGAGAYSAFGGGSQTVDKQSSTAEAPTPANSSIQDSLAADQAAPLGTGPSGTGQSFSDARFDALMPGQGGPSGTGQSFSDARYDASMPAQGGPSANGNVFSDARFDAGLGAGNTTAPTSPTSPNPTNPLDRLSSNGVPRTPVNVPLSADAAAATGKPSLLDSAKSGLSGVGSFLDRNKELTKLAAGALDGAFGNSAQQTSLLKQQIAMKQKQIDLATANANNLQGLRLGVAPNPNALPLR